MFHPKTQQKRLYNIDNENILTFKIYQDDVY